MPVKNSNDKVVKRLTHMKNCSDEAFNASSPSFISSFGRNHTNYEPVWLQIYLIQNLSDSKPIWFWNFWYWTCLILNLRYLLNFWTYLILNLIDSKPTWFRTYLVSNIFGSKSVRFQTYQVPNLSGSKPIWIWTYLIPNQSDTKTFRYCTIRNRHEAC